MTNDFFLAATHRKLLGILAVLGFIYLMSFNHVISLTHPDEVFYVDSAKEMIEHNSWMTPFIFGQPQFEKPIFFYWLLIVALKIFGVTAFAGRFWPAFFGMGAVWLTYWIAWMLLRNKRAAFLSALVLCSSFMHLAMSRAVLTDMVFSFWVVLSLGFFYFAYTEPRFRSLGIIFCLVISGVAVLTKGLLGFVFPFLAIIGFLALQRQLSFLKNFAWILGALLFLAIVLPWHLLMIDLYGRRFLDEYLQNVHVRRIFDAEHNKSNTWYFYLGTMIGGMFPWSFFLFPAFGRWLSARRNRNLDPGAVFLLLWILVVFVVVQSAQSKLASYILPVFPALAIVIGFYLDQLLEKFSGARLRLLDWTAGLIAVLVGAGAIAAILFGQHHHEIVLDMGPIYIFSSLAMLVSAMIFYFIFRVKYLPAIFSISSIALLVMVFSLFGHSSAEPWVSCKEISDELNQIDRSRSTVLASKFYVRGVRFYTGRDMAVIDINGKGFFSDHPIPFLNTDEKVRKFLESQPVTYCIVKESNHKDLERIAHPGFRIQYLGEKGGKIILKIEKLSPSAQVKELQKFFLSGARRTVTEISMK